MSSVKFVEQPQIPKLIYTTKAYARLLSLMGSTHAKTKEFGFLGLVQAVGYDYLVLDFKLIPQEKCSGAYWESNDEKYPEWLAKNVPIECRRLLRLHGHSHVNMNTSPSGVDAQQIKQMFDSVNDFFIQFICNHEMKNTINIWDKKLGLIFENVDQYLKIGEDILKINTKKDLVYPEKPAIKDGLYTIKNSILKFNESFSLNLKDLSVNITDVYLTYNTKTGVTLNEKANIENKDIETQFKELIKTAPMAVYNSTSNNSYNTYNYNYGYDDEYYDYNYSNQGKKALKKSEELQSNWMEFGYWGDLSEEEKDYLREYNIYGHIEVRLIIEELRAEAKINAQEKKSVGRPKKEKKK